MGWTHDRARLAALTRHREPDDPALSDAARDFRAERLAAVIRREVDTWPPLSPEQIERLRGLLPYPHPGAPEGDREAVAS